MSKLPHIVGDEEGLGGKDSIVRENDIKTLLSRVNCRVLEQIYVGNCRITLDDVANDSD